MTTTSQDLNALFKEVYRDKVENLVPEGIQLLMDIPFSEKEKVGQSLNVAVRASEDSPFTFTNDAISAVALSEPVPARYLTARVTPTTIVLRAQISYQQAAKAASKKKSIEEGTKEILDSLKLSMDRKLEDSFFNGSRDILDDDGNVTGSTLKGLEQLLTTTSGNLFGIDTADESGRWVPQTYDVSGKLTVVKIDDAANVAVEFGLEGRAILYIPTEAFNSLTREFNDRLRIGNEIEVPYSRGIIVVRPSIYVTSGIGYLIKPENCKRIGTTNVTFNTPGFTDQGPFHRMEGNNGFTVTLFTEQALFITKPAQCVRLTGITA